MACAREVEQVKSVCVCVLWMSMDVSPRVLASICICVSVHVCAHVCACACVWFFWGLLRTLLPLCPFSRTRETFNALGDTFLP